MNVWIVFITGLTTGGLSCLAMQGGLLTGLIAKQKELALDEHTSNNALGKDDWLPVTLFLGTKLIAHTILGFLLGALGSVISLSLGVKVAFQIFAALFMLAIAGNLLDWHPLFRYVVLQPPKFLQRKIRAISKDENLFAPAMLGLFTIFIPCGVTQAMEVVAINSGDPIQGALTMFAFVLGTSPLFAIIGVATSRFSEMWRERFMKFAAYALVVMSLYALNGAMVVIDSPFSVQKVFAMYQKVQSIEKSGQVEGNNTKVQAGSQDITIEIESHGYNPNHFTVKAGQPVNLTLANKGAYTCASAFIFKEFGISTFVQPGQSGSFTFTPEKPGRYIFACSMGMYTGVMNAI